MYLDPLWRVGIGTVAPETGTFETMDTRAGLGRVFTLPYRSRAGRGGLIRVMEPLGDVAEPLHALEPRFSS